MHSFPGNWVAVGRAVVYYARTGHALSGGVKCWQCNYVHREGYNVCLLPSSNIIPLVSFNYVRFNLAALNL